MPELPEVETTRLGLLPVLGQTVAQVTVRNHGMRWPIPQTLAQTLQGLALNKLERRAKYILATMQHGNTTGTLLLHLGMSGRLCLLEQFTPPEKHDHFDMAFADGRVIRLRDPRRFGAVLWLEGDVNQHPLLASLGPEPLQESFNAKYLHQNMRTRTAAIKTTIMDAHLVVGVGNIYASESLFRARIAPQTPANKLSLEQCERLVAEIKATLSDALKAGGSSLRDFFWCRWQPGILSTNLLCVWQNQRTMQSLRQADIKHSTRAALYVLLWGLPESHSKISLNSSDPHCRVLA